MSHQLSLQIVDIWRFLALFLLFFRDLLRGLRGLHSLLRFGQLALVDAHLLLEIFDFLLDDLESSQHNSQLRLADEVVFLVPVEVLRQDPVLVSQLDQPGQVVLRSDLATLTTLLDLQFDLQASTVSLSRLIWKPFALLNRELHQLLDLAQAESAVGDATDQSLVLRVGDVRLL